MLEWTLGITDSSPYTWKSLEPTWEDERITASSSNSFFEVMNKLCQTVIKNRREYDHGVGEHLWNMKIMSLEDAIKFDPRNPRASEERFMQMHGRDNSDEDMSDDSDDEDETKYRGNIIIQCPNEEYHGGYEDFE